MKSIRVISFRPVALLLAFLASLAIHAMLLFGMRLALPMLPESRPLQVEMKPMPEGRVAGTLIDGQSPKLQGARRLFRQTAKRRAVRIKRSVVTARDAPALIVPGSGRALPAELSRIEESESALTDAAGELGAIGNAEEETRLVSAQTGDGDGATSQVATQEAITMREFPPRGRILYRVDRGDQEFEIGRAISDWEFVEGHYVLRLQMETTGLVWLFKSYRIDMESRGRLTARGLQPEHFTIRRNGEVAKERAEFDWVQMRVSIADRLPQPLDPGAQDLLSFNFHLGFMPDPKVATHLSIATGKKYAIYPLEVVGDEEIEVPMGLVQTLHVRSAGEQTTELWLAYDYFLLPVKIRHVDRKGSSFVQVATGVHVDAEMP